MAKCEMKSIVTVFLVLMMLVFAQAGDSPPPSAASVILCVGECGLKCRPVFEIIEVYAACVAVCGLKCHKKQSKAAYDCTTSCALSKSIDANTGIYSYFTFPFFITCYWYQAIILTIMIELNTCILTILLIHSLSDARGIDAYVGSCLEACKNK